MCSPPSPSAGTHSAVVHDGEGLSSDDMLRFTRWMNLSETTFLLPPTEPAADYRVRIFTLVGELDFAGHPTLGTCHAWLEAGGVPKSGDTIVQQCPAGLVPLRHIEGRLAFEAPPVHRDGPVSDTEMERIVGILGISRDDVVDAAWVDNGPGWVAVLLGSAEEVLAVRAKDDGRGQIDIGVVGPQPDGSDTDWEIRALFTDDSGGLREDPVTGSLNASVAQWLLRSGRATAPYVASQGTVLGRTGPAAHHPGSRRGGLGRWRHLHARPRRGRRDAHRREAVAA